MVRRRKKLRINKLVLPVALILAVSVFVAAVVLYPTPQNPPPPSKFPAAEYFQIIDTSTSPPSQFIANKTQLKLYNVAFTIKAVKGPAHELAVLSWANSPVFDVGDLLQGESAFVELQSDNAYVTPTMDPQKGFEVKIRVTSIEAEGQIILYLTLES